MKMNLQNAMIPSKYLTIWMGFINDYWGFVIVFPILDYERNLIFSYKFGLIKLPMCNWKKYFGFVELLMPKIFQKNKVLEAKFLPRSSSIFIKHN
jgi:hypothetical protein